MQIPLGVGAYSRPYAQLPEIKCENRFFEQNPLGAEQVALLSRPGTKLLLEVGKGPIRSLYAQPGIFDEDLFIVSAGEFYRWSGVGDPQLITGSIGGSGSPVMTSAAVPDWQAVFITDGLALQYYEGPDGETHELKNIPVPDGESVVDLATLAGYVICAIGGTHKFRWLRPGEVEFDPLDFSSAENEPDLLVNIAVVGDQLWLFGESTLEVWYLTGDADQPFAPAQGRALGQGIIPGTLAQHQDKVFVVGQDKVAYQITSSADRISHHGMEELFRRWQESLQES